MGRNTAEEGEAKEDEDLEDEQENKTLRVLNHAALSISFFVMFIDTIKMVFISDTSFDNNQYVIARDAL